MVHQFGVAPSVVAALESRYQIRKKKGSDLVLYEMLSIDDKLNKRFGLTPAQILTKLDKYGLSWHSMADTHKLFEKLSGETEFSHEIPVGSIRDGRVVFQCQDSKALRSLHHTPGEYV
mmetsp:Transcript_38206/g.90088  ORF Transcript_38206/g.90088 Transcript_38206/m.90088 type:complete len:118 (-) Transcript_38206:389-742(-)